MTSFNIKTAITVNSRINYFRMSVIEAIQATALDALSCKIYAINRGYYQDDALLRLCAGDTDRKSPEIARGTWARVVGVRDRLKRFLDQGQQVNVVNCGAGFDTGFWYGSSNF